MDFNKWTYILDKSKFPIGNVSKLVKNGILGKWKYKIAKDKFKILYSKLETVLKKTKEVVNAKYIEDVEYVELNVYCLDKNKKVLEIIKSDVGIEPYSWKTDKETLSELFTRSFDLFSVDLIKTIKEMKDFDDNTKDSLIKDSIKMFIIDYNILIKKENLPHDKVLADDFFFISLFNKIKDQIV